MSRERTSRLGETSVLFQSSSPVLPVVVLSVQRPDNLGMSSELKIVGGVFDRAPQPLGNLQRGPLSEL